jgi:heme a synthase
MRALTRELPSASPDHRSFTRHTWFVLAFTLGVVLFGALVRITGSGAGCGQHWPSCQGEIIHLPRRVSTWIEYTHRLTSALCGLLALWLAIRSLFEFGPRHPVRRTLLVTCVLMAVEGLIGRELVRAGLVGQDASLRRAIIMPLHLVSTSALTASLALAAWWSRPPSPESRPAGTGLRVLTYGAAGWLLLVSATGAVTALGDTLYPVSTPELRARIAEAANPALHFLERVRAVHPLLALIAAVSTIVLATRASDRSLSSGARSLGRAVLALTLSQVVAGTLNVLLSAPAWLQLVHLLLASLLWVGLVLLGTELSAPRTTPR